MHVCVCMCVYACVYMHVCVCMCMCVCAYVCVHCFCVVFMYAWYKHSRKLILVMHVLKIVSQIQVCLLTHLYFYKTSMGISKLLVEILLTTLLL